jgi:hypothetical protein
VSDSRGAQENRRAAMINGTTKLISHSGRPLVWHRRDTRNDPESSHMNDGKFATDYLPMNLKAPEFLKFMKRRQSIAVKCAQSKN